MGLLPARSRRYFKKRAPPPDIKYKTNETYRANIHWDLGTGGRADAKARSELRKVLLGDLASGIVDVLRAEHINITMAVWRAYFKRGMISNNVAVIVDGSPDRPIKNVKFAGRIIIVANPDMALVAEAAQYLWNFMIRYATSLPYGVDYARKKQNSYSYRSSFEMYISDKTFVGSAGVGNLELNEGDWIAITNDVPYAAKLERHWYPSGVFWLGYKAVRKKYGKQLALRFDYVESSSHKIKGGDIPTAQPVIRIGLPNAFPSHTPNMGKLVRDSARPRKGRQTITKGAQWKRKR